MISTNIGEESKDRIEHVCLNVNVPSKGIFSNLKDRLGEDLYNKIFHILVDIFRQIKMVHTFGYCFNIIDDGNNK